MAEEAEILQPQIGNRNIEATGAEVMLSLLALNLVLQLSNRAERKSYKFDLWRREQNQFEEYPEIEVSKPTWQKGD